MVRCFGVAEAVAEVVPEGEEAGEVAGMALDVGAVVEAVEVWGDEEMAETTIDRPRQIPIAVMENQTDGETDFIED